MKYVKQFSIILMMSLLGELLKIGLPFPVPASVYGMVLLFFALLFGVVKLDQIKEASLFFVEIMPVLFVSAGVGLMDSWGTLQPILLPVIIIMLVTTVIVMVVAGHVVQSIIHFTERRHQQ